MLIAQNLSKHYPSLKGGSKVSMRWILSEGRRVLAIRGHSGGGKATLLLTLGADVAPQLREGRF